MKSEIYTNINIYVFPIYLFIFDNLLQIVVTSKIDNFNEYYSPIVGLNITTGILFRSSLIICSASNFVIVYVFGNGPNSLNLNNHDYTHEIIIY